MPNPYFHFKQFTVHQDHCAMKVTTDACLFGAWVASDLEGQAGRVLDIGAGTGLLSLMVAQKTETVIDAVEIQEADFLQAKENIAQSPWSQRIHAVHSDVLQYDFFHRYDVILSNPPFFEQDLKTRTAGKNIAHHDEGLLLAGLVTLIRQQLDGNGSFYLLFPVKREPELREALCRERLFINRACWVQQTERHPPFRIMIKGSFRHTPEESRSLMIRNSGVYSDGFVQLLKPYYLHL